MSMIFGGKMFSPKRHRMKALQLLYLKFFLASLITYSPFSSTSLALSLLLPAFVGWLCWGKMKGTIPIPLNIKNTGFEDTFMWTLIKLSRCIIMSFFFPFMWQIPKLLFRQTGFPSHSTKQNLLKHRGPSTEGQLHI